MGTETKTSSLLNIFFILIAGAVAFVVYAYKSADDQNKEACARILAEPQFSCEEHLSYRNSQKTTYEDGSSTIASMTTESDTCAAKANADATKRSMCLANPKSGGEHRY